MASATGEPAERRRQPFLLLLIVLTAQLCSAARLGADEHPGHGSKVVLGVLKEATAAAIVVEVLDPGRGGTTLVRIELQRDTRFRIDKERLTTLDGMIGQRAIVSVDWEDDDRGGQILKASEVRFTRPKKR